MLYSHNDLKKALATNAEIIREDNSIIMTALDYLNESNNQLRLILNSANISVVTEGVFDDIKEKTNGLSFVKIIGKIIEFLNNFFIRIVKEFVYALARINYTDSVLKMHKKALEKYDANVLIDFPFCNYINLEADIPSRNDLKSFAEDYCISLGDIEKDATNCHSGEELASVIREKISELQNKLDNGYLDIIRGSIFDKFDLRNVSNAPVSADEFKERLHKAFRQESSGITSAGSGYKMTLDNSLYHECLQEFFNANKLIKSVEKNRDIVKGKSRIACVKMQTIDPAKFIVQNKAYATNIASPINEYCRLRCKVLNDICNIYCIAFAEKLQAIKDSVVQDKKVLYVALKEVIIRGGKDDE